MSIKTFIKKSVAIFLVSIITTASATRVSNESSVISTGRAGLTDDFGVVGDKFKKDNTDEESSLHEGVITIVDTLRDRIKVNGSWLYIDSQRTRLFRHGQAVQASALTVGQLLKFTLSAANSEHRVPNVIYVP